MIKNILIAGLLIFLVMGVGSAGQYFIYDGSGVDTFTWSGAANYWTITKRSTAQAPFYYQAFSSISGTATYIPAPHQRSIMMDLDGGTNNWCETYSATQIGESLFMSQNASGYLINRGGGYYWLEIENLCDAVNAHTHTVVCSNLPFEVGISGTTCGLDNVSCYINTTGDFIQNGFDDLTGDNSYEFTLANNTDYRIEFNDGHQYNFTYNGTHITYDRDICQCITLEFYDRCATHVDGLQLYYWSTSSPTVMSTFVDGYTWDGFVFGDNVEIGDNIHIIAIWYDGTQKYVYTITESPQHINIVNIPITYEMGVRTVTNTSAPISGVQVSISQDCAYGGTYNKITSGGWAWFDECSNTGGSLTVSKSGYKTATMPFPTLMANAWDYRTSYIITLESDGSINDTQGDFNDTVTNTSAAVTPDVEYDLDDDNPDLHDGVEIWFQDVNGHRTTKISDQDTYVDLWFINKNSDGSDMSLEFQQSYTGNYYWDELSWTVHYKKFGFKRIYNVNFTPYNYYYRGNIYNDSISQWNRIRYLEVANESKEQDEHYENLSTTLWFRYATVDHKMDYRNDVEIICSATSNNSTLLDLDIELYDNAVLVDYINLTWADFAGASIKWLYQWYPDHDYITGHNYTTKLIGYNGYVLRTDHVDCYTDDVIRKNKLTIGVKDRAGGNLNNCYIYLEDWGSLPTGSTYYNAYEGIDNGDYRYKATKSGYSGGGWETVNLTDEDKIVWYVLSEDYTNTSTTAQKFTDDDIKGFFFPLMFFLLVCIVLGGLKYVAS